MAVRRPPLSPCALSQGSVSPFTEQVPETYRATAARSSSCSKTRRGPPPTLRPAPVAGEGATSRDGSRASQSPTGPAVAAWFARSSTTRPAGCCAARLTDPLAVADPAWGPVSVRPERERFGREPEERPPHGCLLGRNDQAAGARQVSVGTAVSFTKRATVGGPDEPPDNHGGCCRGGPDSVE